MDLHFPVLSLYFLSSLSLSLSLPEQWRYDETTAAYLLLLQQKLRGKQPKILLPPKYDTFLTQIVEYSFTLFLWHRLYTIPACHLYISILLSHYRNSVVVTTRVGSDLMSPLLTSMVRYIHHYTATGHLTVAVLTYSTTFVCTRHLLIA